MTDTLANRHNNPGNLRDPSLGTFRQFSTPQDGMAALLNDLQAKKNGTTTTGIGPSSTLADFASKYAPDSDGNDPQQYTANLANHMGVRPDTPISQLDIGKWADAIANAEGYVSDGPQTKESKPVEITPPKETLGEHLTSRVQDLGNAVSGKGLNPLSRVIQSGGAIAGGINDVVGAGIEKIPGVKQVENAIGGLVGKAANTGVGKSIVGGVNKFSQNHPELSKDISSAGSIVGLVGGGIGAKKLVEGGLAKAAGKDALSSIVEDITPELSGKAAAKNIAKRGTSKSLITGEISAATDPAKMEVAQAISESVPKYSKLSTFSDKVNGVRGGIENTAKELVSNLKNAEVQPILTPEDLSSLKQGMELEISKNPVLVGDPGEQARRIYNHFEELLPKGRDITMEDVLVARKKLDSWIESIKGAGAFDPKMENAFTTGLRAVRQGANNLMEAKVPEAGVKRLLRKQTLLYDALDGLAPRAAKEIGTTRASRFFGKHPLITGALKKSGAVVGTGLTAALGLKGINRLTGD